MTWNKAEAACWASGVVQSQLYDVVVSTIEGRTPRWLLFIIVPLVAVNMAAVAKLILGRFAESGGASR